MTNQVQQKRTTVAFGPAYPGRGSWEWVGADIQNELSKYFQTERFTWRAMPDCDILFIVKQIPDPNFIERIPDQTAIVYCPIDYFNSEHEIKLHEIFLRRCSCIVVHCERLRKFFKSYTDVEYIDHHIKFVPQSRSVVLENFILWVGLRNNIAPLIQWANKHPLPFFLRVLTSTRKDGSLPTTSELGFERPDGVLVEKWTPSLHKLLASKARCSIDIKGNQFCQFHKPPTKALDFIASGIPLALNPGSSGYDHLERLGFNPVTPLDEDRWLSLEYREETERFGQALKELLSLNRIGLKFRRLVSSLR